jgi:pyruvate-ferredoxin/flavodoxin oxidoreductase
LPQPFCPRQTKIVSTLDRTKEPGAAGEPIYQDVITALAEAGVTYARGWRSLRISRARNSPRRMAKAVFDNMASATPKNHFTVGINDDVTHTSLAFDPLVRYRAR